MARKNLHNKAWRDGGEKIRILFFLNSLVFGGVEKHVLDILNNIDKNTFSVFLVCPEELLPQFRSLATEGKVTFIPLTLRSFFSIKPMLRFRRLLKTHKPHIVHSHLYFAARFATPLARSAGCPLVLETAHIVERWRRGYKKIFLLLDIISCLFADKIIAVSTAVKDYYVKYKKVHASKIDVFHNWCELDKFDPARYEADHKTALRKSLNIPPGSKTISLLGRLEKQKGHEYLLKALPRVLARFSNTVVLFIGDGVLRENLRDLAVDLGIEKYVLFLGFRKNVPEILGITDIIVLPSLFEGLPLTLIEAAAMEVPVVASRVDGTPDVVVDGITGLLFEPENHRELADRIIELLEQEEHAKEMGRRARIHALENFDGKKQIKALEDFYIKNLAER